MSTLQVRRIKSALKQRFDGLIDLSDVKATKPEEIEPYFLTRSLAAYSLVVLSNVDPKTAADSVTDGFDDNGVDLIHHNKDQRVLYLIQSKWDSTGSRCPQLGDVLKFVQGVKDLVNAEFLSFNSKIQARIPDIEAALDDADTRILVVVSHTGSQPLGVQSEKALAKLLLEFNDTSDAMKQEVLGQSRIYSSLLGEIDESASIDLTLHEWGTSKDPLKSFYGQVEVGHLAEIYATYGTRLFVDNLRNYRGSTDVNEAIQGTLQNRPEHFLYLNNGLTALCKTVLRKLIKGMNRDAGSFVCTGLSIVNGAQTVGSIAAALAQDPSAASARVLIRIVSLEGAPDGFGKDVTIATNTQNRIERRDFMALEPLQRRLAAELHLDGKEYLYKSGEVSSTSPNSCTLIEATVALACSHTDITYAVQAKREVGLLWDTSPRGSATVIFPDSLTSTRLWRSVEILREVDAALSDARKARSGRERLIAVHGNRFILHKVFVRLGAVPLGDADKDFGPTKDLVPKYVDELLTLLIPEVEKDYSDSYPASLFKNLSKCRALGLSIK